MSSPGMGLSDAPQPAIASALEKKLRAERVVKVGASWFITVGVLSIINSVLAMSGAGIHFIFGLGVTELVDTFAHQVGQTGFALDLVINGFVAGVFVLFWHFARRGQQWAFLLGMGLYALDALLMLYFHDMLAAAFHGYALYRMYSGMSGIPALKESESAMTMAGAPIQPR
jgi:magnesium-transporting ATPase (P-type)